MTQALPLWRPERAGPKARPGQVDPIPRLFCWTRFGTEAGETIESILRRKEVERRENDGIFLWGIGNSVGPGIARLTREVDEPEVLFSPIKSQPRAVDVSPSLIVEWRSGETMDGRRFRLAPSFHVRGGSATAVMGRRYALVCRSDDPLGPAHHGVLQFRQLRNLASGTSLGASQVTAVVRRELDYEDTGREYVIALRAKLVDPYFIRLCDPLPLASCRRHNTPGEAAR